MAAERLQYEMAAEIWSALNPITSGTRSFDEMPPHVHKTYMRAANAALAHTPPQCLAARDGEVLALREALANLLGKVDEYGVDYWDTDSLPDEVEAIIAASTIARQALTNSDQAAKDAEDRILEKAAKIADKADEDFKDRHLGKWHDPAPGMMARDIAARIRAMKGGE